MDVYVLGLENSRFRKVLMKENYIKITVMSLIGRREPRNFDDDDFEIPWEKHQGGQVLQVLKGVIIVKVEGRDDVIILAGQIAVIPPMTRHYVANLQLNATSKLFSIYTPPGKMGTY